MKILNIAGYKFSEIADTESLKDKFSVLLAHKTIKGTILISREGVNLYLAGTESEIREFQQNLPVPFQGMRFHESYSETVPFKRLKVKIKHEIISMRQDCVNVNAGAAPSIKPAELKQWYDENREFTVLDTRNDFEVEMGTFKNAVNLHIKDFGEFAGSLEHIAKDKPIVMFCTGGIRCEKAAIYMEKQGYKHVLQLDGGILGYFREVGGDYYDGSCFVFDDRIAVDSQLNQVK